MSRGYPTEVLPEELCRLSLLDRLLCDVQALKTSEQAFSEQLVIRASGNSVAGHLRSLPGPAAQRRPVLDLGGLQQGQEDRPELMRVRQPRS